MQQFVALIKTARTLSVDILCDGAALIFSIGNSHLEREKLCLSEIKAFEDRWGIKMGSFCVSKYVDYTNLHCVGGRIAQIFENKITGFFWFWFKKVLRVTTRIKTCTVCLVRAVQFFWRTTGYFNLIILWSSQRQWSNLIWFCKREKKNTFTIRYNDVC